MDKVLWVDHTGPVGGAQHSLLELLPQLSSHRFDARLVCGGGELARRAQAASIEVETVNLPQLKRQFAAGWRWPQGARQLARRALDLDVTLLHANTLRAAAYVSLASRLSGIPWAWHVRDFGISENPSDKIAGRLMQRALGHNAAAVVAISQAIKRSLPTSLPIEVIPNGIAFDLDGTSTRSGAEFRARWNIPRDAVVIGTVARLRPWKGQVDFLRAMKIVAAEVKNAHFVIVGGNPFGADSQYTRDIRGLADEFKLADRITFCGHLTDTGSAFAAMDVFVHAAQPEPFGRVVVEAMAAKIPVVAYRHGAMPEIVTEAVGCLVEPRDVAMLARTVASLCGDEPRRRHLGECAQSRAHAEFSVERLATKVAALYRRILRHSS